MEVARADFGAFFCSGAFSIAITGAAARKRFTSSGSSRGVVAIFASSSTQHSHCFILKAAGLLRTSRNSDWWGEADEFLKSVAAAAGWPARWQGTPSCGSVSCP
jgi:hypothetical protein